jgi:serine/threonine protein kinase
MSPWCRIELAHGGHSGFGWRTEARNRGDPQWRTMDRFLLCETNVRHLPHLQARRISLLALLLLSSTAAGNEGKTVVTRLSGVERRFVVDRKISRGAFCNGYRGHEVGTEQPVAIKILRSGRLAEGVADTFDLEHGVLDAARDPGLTASFGIGATEEPQPRRALVLELAAGTWLGAPYGRWQPRPVGKAVRIALRLAHAVDALEEAGWRHNDIHPGNIHILNGQSRTTKLLDLGNATPAREGSRRTNRFYNADDAGPPQVNGDVYSVGAVLLHLVTGRSELEALAAVPVRTATMHGTTVSLAGVIARALHPDPLQRYTRARELIDALEPFATGP